jgi:hypothetical protein
MKRIVVAAIAVIGVTGIFIVQPRAQELPRRLGGENGPKKAAAANKPAPMLADGPVDLSGVWTGGGDATIPRQLGKEKVNELLLPWARAKFAQVKEADDPYFYCMPGGPLRITGGFAWRLVQTPTEHAKYIFMLQEGNAHTFRQIFMDGRKHPADPDPGWYGHSIGHWEGKTLVVDTVGLNDKFWLDGSGIPHTEKLHLIERYTRTDFNTLERVVTIDDPGTFTKPFDVKFTAKLAEPNSEIVEYYCIENNQWGERTNKDPLEHAIPVQQ